MGIPEKNEEKVKNTDKKSNKTVKEKKDKAESKNVGEKRLKLSSTAIAIIATVGVLFLIILVVGIIHVVEAVKSDKFFDYVDSDLEKYVTFSESDYKNYNIEIDIAKPHDIDVDNAILALLAASKGEVKNEGAMITSAVTISPADTVYIWYRGYTFDANGEKVFKSGMCNFSTSSAAELTIGSGNYVPGFELGLVGKNTGDYPKFEKITEGEIKEGQIVYVSYKRLVEGGDSKKDTKSASGVRIDLSDTTIDETFGTGFRDQILAAKIGEKTSFGVTLSGKTHNYTELTVDFVTECEVDPLVVKCYFPYDYSDTTLRNQDVYFEVYVNGVVQYDCPEFNDEFVLKTVQEKDSPITEEELRNDYEGETLTEKYKAYAKKIIDEAYEENYKSMVEDAMWNHYLEKAVVKKYPQVKVDKIHKEYIDDVYYQFDQTGGSIQNSYTQEYETYDNIDDFAIAYLGLTYSANQDWKSVLYTMSENLVKERLVLYYLLQVENLYPTEQQFAEELAAVKQEYIDEYLKQYLEYEEKSREDYNDEEYAEFVKAREAELFDYYDEEYFEETTYYEIALREFLKWAKVSTLDDRSNLPQTK